MKCQINCRNYTSAMNLDLTRLYGYNVILCTTSSCSSMYELSQSLRLTQVDAPVCV